MKELSINEHTIGVVVLNWNSADDSIACVKSLLLQSYKNLLVIIIDNNSSDNSPERLKQFADSHPNVVFRHNSVNLGFTGGINTGIRYCLDKKINYVALLNPDATADKNWLSSLHDELISHSDTGIVTGLFINKQTGLCDSTGEFYTTWGLPGPRNRGDDVKKTPTKSDYVFGASGGDALYRASVFDTIGLFDEHFFMYYEDVDISFRAQLAGFKARFTPNAIAYHKQGASSAKVPGLTVYNTFKNLPIVFIKNVPGRLFWSVGVRFFATYWLIFASAVRHGNGWPATKGMLASIAKKPHACVQRWHIQRRRQVSVGYIRSILHDGPLPNQTGLLKFRKLFKRRQ